MSFVAGFFSLISLAVAGFSLHRALRADRDAKRPVLIFVLGEDYRWHLQNLGNGPALDIVVSQIPKGSREWQRPTRVPPQRGKDGEVKLGWLKQDNDHALGAVYMDFKGRSYNSVCRRNRTDISEGRGNVPMWDETEIVQMQKRVADAVADGPLISTLG